MRLRKFGARLGVLIVEGGDESKLLRRFCRDRAQVIPAGGKEIALEAHANLHAGEDERIVFLVDCDYDVPTGKLNGQPNLILTRHPALEVDLLSLDGVTARALETLLPHDRFGDADFDELAEEVCSRGLAIAEAVGRLRWTARHHNIRLNLDVDMSCYREISTDRIDEERLLDDVLRQSRRCGMSAHQIRGFASGLPKGAISTHGHDLIAAIEDVLIRDLGASARAAKAIAGTVQLAVTETDLTGLDLYVRLRRWEESTDREIFGFAAS